MLILIKDGLVSGGNWLAPRADAYLKAWREDPISRLREIKDGLTRFMKNQVCDKLGAAAVELGTVQGFLDTVWGLTPPGMFAKAPARFEALVGEDPWTLLSEAVAAWFDDFGTRMLNGAEQAAWVAEPFPDNALITGTITYMNEMRYTFGYVFGYLAEQATVGLVSGKAVTLTASMTMKGVKLAAANATRLASRTGATIAAKGAVLKKAVAPVAMSAALRASLEEGFVLAARTPTPGAAGKNILSVIEESYRALPGPAPAATISKLVDDIVAQPRLAALGQQSWGCLEILSSTARLQHRLGVDATDKALRNWPKYAQAIAVNGESGLANDLLRYADFEQAMKLDTPQGRAVARDFLESLDGKTAQQVLDGDLPLPGSIKNLYAQMYHYADFDTMKFFAFDNVGEVVGRWRLPERLAGRYVTPELINTQALAKSKLQLPLDVTLQEIPTKGRFRFEYATSDVASQYRIPRANVHSGADNAGAKLWREIIVKDNPARGTGGVPQFVESVAREGTLYDTVTNQYVRDKLHLQEILDANP
jgi:hypothetical protein